MIPTSLIEAHTAAMRRDSDRYDRQRVDAQCEYCGCWIAQHESVSLREMNAHVEVCPAF